MKNSSWLKFVHSANSASAIREIFNKTYGLVERQEVRELFFNRISYLIEINPIGSSVDDLEALREDIEDEIELKTKRNVKLEENELRKAFEEQQKKVIKEKLTEERDATQDLIRDLKFESARDLIYRAERELIVKALIALEDNRTQTAKVLGISIRTLRNKLNEYAKEARSADLALPETETYRQEGEIEV